MEKDNGAKNWQTSFYLYQSPPYGYAGAQISIHTVQVSNFDSHCTDFL